MKNSGAQAFYPLTAPSAYYAIIPALKQQGANIPAIIPGDGYEAQFVEAPLVSVDQGLIAPTSYATPQINPKAADPLVVAMRKYLGYKGTQATPTPPGAIYGWASAELAIEGLEAAGKNLTAASFLKGLHSMKAYTADGLQAGPVNLSVAKQGTYAAGAAGNCNYALKVVGKTFVPISKKPFCTPANFLSKQ
jgi:hypothetical protein